MKICITGAAGFIGMHLAESLIRDGHNVVSIDSFAPSYMTDISLRRARHLKLNFDHDVLEMDISTDRERLLEIFNGCSTVVHLAAWPGVRKSSLVPSLYFKNNVQTFNNVLEACDAVGVSKLLYASSSSVYGDAARLGPVKESGIKLSGLKSYYAATKLINEIDAAKYPFERKISILGLRFFTVFGPWGRPDMAYWKFAEQIINNQSLTIYGQDGGIRNFTYISDAISILRSLISQDIPHHISAINIANSEPTETINLVRALEARLGIIGKHLIVPRPSMDAEVTWADQQLLKSLVGTLKPVAFEEGVNNFVDWFIQYRTQ